MNAIVNSAMKDSLTTLTRQVLFTPLSEPGRTETVVSRIRSAITLGIYADGEQLPNEIDLAAQLGVSPVTLRDALRTVRKEGLVRTTRGRSGGTFVIAPDESNVTPIEQSLRALSPIELRDLLDWQTTITAQAAVLATERASQHEIATLGATAAQVGAAQDAVAARRAASRFFIEMAASSRSSLISKAAISLQIDYSPLTLLGFRHSAVRAKTCERATELVQAIAERDSERARHKIVQLNEVVRECIEQTHYDLRESPLHDSVPRVV